MKCYLCYPVVEVLASIGVASIIWFGGNGILVHANVSSVAIGISRKSLLTFHMVRSVMTLGVLVAFMQYAQRFFRPIQDLSEKYNILQSAMAAGERVFKLLDTKIEVTSPAIAKRPQGPGRIEFDHVWFAYNVSGQAGGATGVLARPEGASVAAGLRPDGAGQSPVTTQSASQGNEPDWVDRK